MMTPKNKQTRRKIMNSKIFSAVSALMVALSPVTVTRADSTITMQDAAGATQAVIEVKGNMARMSTPGQSDYVLYDKSRDMIIHVNSDRQEYTEIDRATVSQLSETVSEMKQQLAPQIARMREQLKSLPPEQRTMIEQQMGGMVSLGALETKPAEPVELVKRGSNKVAGFDCQVYEAMQGEEKLSEVLSAGFGGVSHMMLGGAEGVPVSVKEFKGGHEYAVAGVSDKALDETRFSEYKAYRKQQMPTLQ
jgi:hypothetical protein